MNTFLIAADADPVAKAIESLLSDGSGFQRVTAEEFVGTAFGIEDVLLLGENESSSELIPEAGLPSLGMIQHLGCRPSASLLNLPSRSDSQVIVAGISPNISPRVANRVIGFTGPLPVRPMPDWGVIGVGEVGTTNHALVLVVGFETHANVEFAVVGDLIHHTGMPDEPRFFGISGNTKIAILDN